MRTDLPQRGVESTTLTRRPLRMNLSRTTVLAEAAPTHARSDLADAVRLTDGGIWSRVPAPTGLRVDATRGKLWITQAGEAGDTIVREGEAFATTARGKVVVQAMGAATFEFHDIA